MNQSQIFTRAGIAAASVMTLVIGFIALTHLLFPAKPDSALSTKADQLAPTDSDLASDVGIDYTQLRELLAAQNWDAADSETWTVMTQAADQGVNRLEINASFPCTDLKTIDQLWGQYSGDRYGFRVQKQLWATKQNRADWALSEFSALVGWTKDSAATNPLLPGYYPQVFANIVNPAVGWEQLSRCGI